MIRSTFLLRRHSAVVATAPHGAAALRRAPPTKTNVPASVERRMVVRFSTTGVRRESPSPSGSYSGGSAMSLSLYRNHCLDRPPRRMASLLRPPALSSSSPSSSSSSSSSLSVRCGSSSSSSSGGGDKSGGQTSSSAADGGGEEPPPPTSQEMVLTPGEKVVVGTRLFFWSGALAFASVCGYYIVKELMPTKMSPNAVFDAATAKIRTNEEVKRRFGENFKTYGRDHGGHREGRRNFVEHTEYVDVDTDGSRRTRVRFNLEGQYGVAFVFAEVSDSMPSGEFVYVMVQDKRNGAVINVVDNRSMLLARKMAGGSDAGRDVFARLLGLFKCHMLYIQHGRQGRQMVVFFRCCDKPGKKLKMQLRRIVLLSFKKGCALIRLAIPLVRCNIS